MYIWIHTSTFLLIQEGELQNSKSSTLPYGGLFDDPGPDGVGHDDMPQEDERVDPKADDGDGIAVAIR